MLQRIQEQVLLPTKRDVVLTHLYLKCKQKNIRITEGVRELLYELYNHGPIETEKDFYAFAKVCNQNTPITTADSVRNTMSKLVGMKLVINDGKYKKTISSELIPKDLIENPSTYHIGLDYKITYQEALDAV